jgi:hypothetical protein
MTTNEDEIRHLIAQLRAAYENGEDAEVEAAITALETAVAELKDDEPGTA